MAASQGMLEQERLNGEAGPERPRGSNWKAMPQKMKTLIAVIVLLAVVAVVFLVLVIVLAVKNKGHTRKEAVCVTQECIESAGMIKEYMDASADPCQDFGQFVCGGFYEKYKTPPDRYAINPFSILGEQVMQPIRNILEDPNSATKSTAVLKMKIAYQSCLNDLTNDDEETSKKKLVDNLKEMFDGWPPNLIALDIDRALGFLMILDVEALFTIKMDYNTEGTHQVFKISAAFPSFRSGKRFKQVHTKYIQEVLEKINFPNQQKTAETIFNLEEKLYDIYEDESPKTGEYQISQMQEMYPNFNWNTIADTLFRMSGRNPEEAELNLRFEIMMDAYMDELNNLVASTPRTTFSTYIIWKFVEWATDYLGPSFRVPAIINDYERKLNEHFSKKPIWELCIENIKPGFMRPLTFEYAQIMFDKERLDDVNHQFDIMRESFRKRVPLQDWLDEETKEAVQEKVSHFTVTMAYPPALLVRTQLDGIYQDTEMNPDNLLENIVQLKLLVRKQQVHSLLQSEDQSAWNFDPTNINAFNMLFKNLITIPIGILYPPFYQLKRPQYLNFASLGSTLAHEMGHAFDNTGVLLNIDGSENFFSQEMIDVYMARAQCIVDQTSTFIFNQSGVVKKWNGKVSLNDDIADGVGLLHAYLGYLDWEKSNGPELGLPGLNYTNYQLFFILYAQQFCNTYSRQGAMGTISDNHSPMELRISASIQNSEYFGSHFNCPLGTPMNPKKKCNVWE